MSFTATPLDGSATPIPMSSAVPDSTNTPLALEGGPAKSTGGNSLVPTAVYMYDGYHVTFGTQADASASSDAGTFTFIALFKRLLGKLLVGQQTMANSVGVVIASNQSAVPVAVSTSALYTLASIATSGSTQNSGDLAVASYHEVSIDINTTAQSGTSPTIQYFFERKGADGLYYVLWQSAVLTVAANTLSTSVGPGLAYNQSLGNTDRLRWVVGGSATPTFTHSLNIYAK